MASFTIENGPQLTPLFAKVKVKSLMKDTLNHTGSTSVSDTVNKFLEDPLIISK